LNNLDHINKNFSQKITEWYLINGRDDLPWRKKISPYRVWISEIMLQQTQVKTVIPFFKKFIQKYPNLKSIASASEDDILAMWTGLGFYRRAKNIYKTKEIIKREYGNRFPKEFNELLMLPGIGRSTAGAIMSIAFIKPYPILDANVKRVISRYKNVNLEKKNSTKNLWFLSEVLTPEENIFEYTQGIMDLGATKCIARNPDCEECPLIHSCQGAFKTFELNNKSKKEKSRKKIFFTLAHSNESFLLFKKNEKTFWESLWVPYDNQDQIKSNFFKEPLKSETKNFNHALSHMDLDITIEIFDYKTPFKIKTNLEHRWVNKNQIDKFGLPKPIKTIIENYV
jgi:A/G-specific adenine glycosylase